MIEWVHKQIRKFISWYLYKVSSEYCVSSTLCTTCPYHYREGRFIRCLVNDVRKILAESQEGAVKEALAKMKGDTDEQE